LNRRDAGGSKRETPGEKEPARSRDAPRPAKRRKGDQTMTDNRLISVKIALLKSNLNQTQLAARLNLSLSQLNMVINGRRKTKWIQNAIANALGMQSEVLFPSREEKKPSAQFASGRTDRQQVDETR
jgi:lambda repressor-like predicted transcriptional regulator